MTILIAGNFKSKVFKSKNDHQDCIIDKEMKSANGTVEKNK